MKKVMKGIFLKLMFSIFMNFKSKLHDFHNELPVLPERMKIGEVEKLVANLYDKTEFVIHIRKWLI